MFRPRGSGGGWWAPPRRGREQRFLFFMLMEHSHQGETCKTYSWYRVGNSSSVSSVWGPGASILPLARVLWWTSSETLPAICAHSRTFPASLKDLMANTEVW